MPIVCVFVCVYVCVCVKDKHREKVWAGVRKNGSDRRDIGEGNEGPANDRARQCTQRGVPINLIPPNQKQTNKKQKQKLGNTF